MMTVVVTLSMPCGCTNALVSDDGRLVCCSVDVCRGHWWCECADPADPQECGHVDALLAVVSADG